MRRLAWIALLTACADGLPKAELRDAHSSACGGIDCQPGFHCEFDACVADDLPRPPTGSGQRPVDPLASGRYVFTLERDARRIVRIDSSSLEVAVFSAGLAPMEMRIVGGRELTVLVDALDVVEVLDHRSSPPVNAAWTTARALSHIAVAPSGQHAIVYYDWDDPRAQERQPKPGNINQVTVLYLGDGTEPFADADARAQNVAVGFLPLDVRFSADGGRAVVVSRDGLTPLALGPLDDVASPEPTIPVREGALEIVVDAAAAHAVLRYSAQARIDVVDLSTGAATCLQTSEPPTDLALAQERIVAAVGGSRLAVAPLSAATQPCAAIGDTLTLPSRATRIEIEPGEARALAFEPALSSETLFVIDLAAGNATPLALEKAVAAIAFAGDGRHALAAHLKSPGTPLWDPQREDPDVSVDKSYGVSWLDLDSGAHRLAVSNHAFGRFTFVPADERGEGVTYQALHDPERPVLLRVAHRPGFDDRWIDLAAEPRELGWLPASTRAFVTQEHAFGRVTFLDPAGAELRHVTGFALEAP